MRCSSPVQLQVVLLPSQPNTFGLPTRGLRPEAKASRSPGGGSPAGQHACWLGSLYPLTALSWAIWLTLVQALD